ncbi:MAG TPA: MFS transporter [Anaerolineales bacterium]|nr:MFS transporter [Anaerolineales bacterium]
MIRKITHGIKEYGDHLVAFRPNARLYLAYGIISGIALGIFRLLFNFYILSLGFDEKLLGNLVTTTNSTALIAALPMGYLADYLGRKTSLVIAGILVCFSIAMMAIWPATPMLYAMNVLAGLAQGLAAVTMSPFLMENSSERERTYLFSFSSGLQMISASVGNWIGGYLPSWMAGLRHVGAVSSQAYSGSVLIVAITLAASVIPLLLMHMPRLSHEERTVFAPLSYAARHPKQLTKLILPIIITFIGAGLIMPFMNVFFRVQYHQSDQVIGVLFAWGSLAMGLGLLAAPPLAERYGKIQIVVITQGLSIPFLILLGFSPVFWASGMAFYIRVALMNMSGPIYQTFVMEQVDSSSRAMVASLVNMSSNFGNAFSPTISGILQVNYGFGPPFMGTIILYTMSVFLYWWFWWRKRAARAPVPVSLGSDEFHPDVTGNLE